MLKKCRKPPLTISEAARGQLTQREDITYYYAALSLMVLKRKTNNGCSFNYIYL